MTDDLEKEREQSNKLNEQHQQEIAALKEQHTNELEELKNQLKESEQKEENYKKEKLISDQQLNDLRSEYEAFKEEVMFFL